MTKTLLWLAALGSLIVCAGGCGDSEDNDLGGGALSAAGCTSVANGFGPSGNVPIQVDTVVSGLDVPWGIAFVSNSDFLITERPGRVRIFRNGTLQGAPVAQINVGEEGEGGLLGIALHPDFSSNRLFYVYYTVDKTGGTVNRVERYRLSQDSTSATSDRIIIDDIPAGTFHNGGRLRFGPDGLLYIGTGDARDPALSQNQTGLAGKILRLTPDGAVPGDNPLGTPSFISGIRNTQGFAWLNSVSLFVSDHGPTGELGRSGGDELSVANPGDNLGWPDIWRCQTGSGKKAPLLSWNTATPPGGLAIYTGTSIAAWEGNLIIGTLGSKHLQRVIFNVDGNQVQLTQHEVYLQGDPPSGYGRLRDVLMGPDGHLYVTTSNCDGRGSCPAERDKVLRIRGP